MKALRASSLAHIAATVALASAILCLAGCSSSGGSGADGSALVESKCVPCHAQIDDYTHQYSTLEDWQACMVRMQEYDNSLTDDEAEQIALYLTDLNASA